MSNFRAPAFLSLAALSLSAFSLALTAPLAPLLAQAPPPMMHGPSGHGPYGGGRRRDPLGLTDAQKARMRPIFMSAMQQMQAIQANAALSPAARMAKMQGLQKNVRMQMMAILTPAQRAKAQAMMQARAAGRPGGFGAPRP